MKNIRAALALIAALMLSVPAAQANFAINSIQPEFREGKLFVNTDIDLALNEKVEEALNKGIPLNFRLEIQLQRKREILWNETISEWQIVRQLKYHALSSQYLVGTVGNDQVESFTSLRQALRNSVTLSDHEFPMAHFPGKDEDYQLKLRVSLDIEALPAPLRPVAYTSLDWRINTGWTTWPARR